MKFAAALFVSTCLTFAASACFAADSSVKASWQDLKKLANDVSLQSSQFHFEPAYIANNTYTLDYSSQQIENIDRLTRHQDPEPAPVVRFGFKSSNSASDAYKITQRMLQSLATDGTIGVSYEW